MTQPWEKAARYDYWFILNLTFRFGWINRVGHLCKVAYSLAFLSRLRWNIFLRTDWISIKAQWLRRSLGWPLLFLLVIIARWWWCSTLWVPHLLLRLPLQSLGLRELADSDLFLLGCYLSLGKLLLQQVVTIFLRWTRLRYCFKLWRCCHFYSWVSHGGFFFLS